MKTEILKFREEAGLSLQELADLVGVSKPHVWELEKKGGNPSIATAYKLEKALNCSVYDLFPNQFERVNATTTARFIGVMNLGDEKQKVVHYINMAVNDLNDGCKYVGNETDIAIKYLSLASAKVSNAVKQLNLGM